MKISAKNVPLRLRDDGVPAANLNAIRRMYRNKLIEYIDSGKITLERRDRCPCGGDSFVTVSEKERFGLPFSNMLCRECGLLVLDPHVSVDSLPGYYREIYHPLILSTPSGVTLKDLIREDQGKRIYDFVKGYIDNVVLGICEVGCAGGENLLRFKEEARADKIECELFGCEYEENYVKDAIGKRIVVTSGGTDTIDASGPKFDLIILSHVLEHFSDVNGELKKMSDLLADDGLLYIEVPGLMNLASYDNDIAAYLVHAHNYNFNLVSLRALLSVNGFELIKGTEEICALFKKSDNLTGKSGDRNNCDIVGSFIKESEAGFLKNLSLMQKSKRSLWGLVCKIEYLLFLKRRMGKFYD